MTPNERKERFDRLSRIGCIVCRDIHGVVSEACIHHLKGIKYSSTGKKADDIHTIPLCHNHHQGHQGFHHIGMRAWESMFRTQEEYLHIVNKIIGDTH